MMSRSGSLEVKQLGPNNFPAETSITGGSLVFAILKIFFRRFFMTSPSNQAIKRDRFSKYLPVYIPPFKSAAQNVTGQRTDFKAMNPELSMISKVPI